MWVGGELQYHGYAGFMAPKSGIAKTISPLYICPFFEDMHLNYMKDDGAGHCGLL